MSGPRSAEKAGGGVLYGPGFPPPLWLSEPHPDAVGTYADQALEWIRQRRYADDLVPDDEKEPHPMWAVVLGRALEHDAAGALCWRVVVLSVPRQSTKSTLASELLLWRIHHAGLFGERQIAIHTANKLQAAIRVQEDVHGWAADAGLKVSRRTGQERVTVPDQSRWEITSLQAAFGARPGMAFVDECFDVDLALVQKALVPAQARRRSPQTWLVSTANDACTELMPTYMAKGMAGEDGSVMVALWGLHHSDDAHDERLWPSASPAADSLWLEQVRRHRDEADWAGQWLNVWPPPRVASDAPEWVSPEVWEGLAGAGEPSGPTVVCIDSMAGGHEFGVVQGWLDAEGRVCVRARGGLRRLASALTVCDEWGGDVLRVGLTWTKMLAPERVAKGYGRRETLSASMVLRDAVMSGMVRHRGDAALDEQMRQVELRVTDAGPVIRGRGGADIGLVKLTAWAVFALTRTDDVVMPATAAIY